MGLQRAHGNNRIAVTLENDFIELIRADCWSYDLSDVRISLVLSISTSDAAMGF